MIQKEFNASLDIRNLTPKSEFSVVTHDSNGNKLNITLVDSGKPFGITGYTNITFTVKKPDNTYYIDSEGERLIVKDATKGKISVVLGDAAINVPGMCQATVEVYEDTRRITSARFYFTVIAGLQDGLDPSSDSAIPLLQQLIIDVENLNEVVETTEGKRVTAENGRTTAEAGRASAESIRATTESTRKENETNRISAENARVATEQLRATAENAREILIRNTKGIGEYSSDTQYYKNNIVYHDGCSYIAKVNTKGNVPPEHPTLGNAWWLMLSKRGIDGDETAQEVINARSGFATLSAKIADMDAKDESHKAESMPHIFTNHKTNKKYKFGYQISTEGIPQIIYEEVI